MKDVVNVLLRLATDAFGDELGKRVAQSHDRWRRRVLGYAGR